MTKRAVLFDLDDTLIIEEAAAAAAFHATAAVAARSYEVDADRLAAAVRDNARDLWRTTPVHGYCLEIGVSSWEGLWCEFLGDDLPTRWLRHWAPDYRVEAWHLALIDLGIHDHALAQTLGEVYPRERRARHQLFPDAIECLTRLRDTYHLGVVTNGAPCLQREKLSASGLAEFFDTIVVSGDIGVGKPDPRIYLEALLRLQVTEAVMVGASIRRDVEGAMAAGLRAIWLNRDARRENLGLPHVTTLVDVPARVVELAQ
jgi:putative hydrolase of the HAD superfamily